MNLIGQVGKPNISRSLGVGELPLLWRNRGKGKERKA